MLHFASYTWSQSIHSNKTINSKKIYCFMTRTQLLTYYTMKYFITSWTGLKHCLSLVLKTVKHHCIRTFDPIHYKHVYIGAAKHCYRSTREVVMFPHSDILKILLDTALSTAGCKGLNQMTSTAACQTNSLYF